MFRIHLSCGCSIELRSRDGSKKFNLSVDCEEHHILRNSWRNASIVDIEYCDDLELQADILMQEEMLGDETFH